MKLSSLSQVSALERRRALLINQRDTGHLTGQLTSSADLGRHRAELDASAIEFLRPALIMYLDRQIVSVEDELRAFGIEIDV